MSDSSQDQARLSRRTFLRQVALATAGLSGTALLAACGGSPSTPSAADSGTALPDSSAAAPTTSAATAIPAPGAAAPAADAKKIQLYSLAWQPGAIAAVQQGVDNWNTTNGSRVAIEYVQGDWGKARDFLTTSIAGGVAPEIAQGITAWGNEYGQQGAYLDLNPNIDGSDLKTDLHPQALAAAVTPFGGQVYGLPWCWEVGVMYINADRFKEQNIAIPTNGWTWQEFHSAVKQVNKEPDHYGLGVNLGSSQATEDVIAWMWQTGALVMGESAGQWKIDLEPARPALELWKTIVADDKVVSPDSFGGSVDLFAGFPLGSFSMMQTGCWSRRLIAEAKPSFQWQVVPLPHDKLHANSNEPQTWSITAQTAAHGSANAAWEVVEWMSNKDNQTEVAFGDGLLPTRQSAMKDARFNTEENGWKVVQNEVQYGKPYPKHPAWSEFDERVLGPGIQQYLQGQQTLDQLITTATAEGTKLLDKYKK